MFLIKTLPLLIKPSNPGSAWVSMLVYYYDLLGYTIPSDVIYYHRFVSFLVASFCRMALMKTLKVRFMMTSLVTILRKSKVTMIKTLQVTLMEMLKVALMVNM